MLERDRPRRAYPSWPRLAEGGANGVEVLHVCAEVRAGYQYVVNIDEYER